MVHVFYYVLYVHRETCNDFLFIGGCRLEGEGHENHIRTDLRQSDRPRPNRTREETGTVPEGPPRPTDKGARRGHTEDRNVVGETIGGYRGPT